MRRTITMACLALMAALMVTGQAWALTKITNVAPADGATGVGSPVTLKWSSDATAKASYTIYLSTDGGATYSPVNKLVSVKTTLSWTVPLAQVLPPGTQIFWYVEAGKVKERPRRSLPVPIT